jgi:hypothetical protein
VKDTGKIGEGFRGRVEWKGIGGVFRDCIFSLKEKQAAFSLVLLYRKSPK